MTRQRRRPALVIAALLATLSPVAVLANEPARAAEPDLPPFSIRVASPADDVQHVGSSTEWWYFNVVNPKTKEVFIAQIGSAPIATAATFWYNKRGVKSHAVGIPTGPVISGPGPKVCSTAGCMTYDAAKNAYHLQFAANGVTADIWFNNIIPGVTNGPRQYDGEVQSWTNPVATSNTTGWVWPIGELAPIRVEGWRGYHDHNWGDFDLTNQTYRGWEWGGSHNADGSADVFGGVIDSKGDYYGSVIKATKDGTSYCLSTTPQSPDAIKLEDFSTVNGFDYPRKVTAKCSDGGTVAPQTYTVQAPHVVPFLDSFKFTESIAETSPGSTALLEHFRTKPYYGS